MQPNPPTGGRRADVPHVCTRARYVALVADKPLTLRFNVDNVANKRYWASAFDSFRPDLLQGAPRTFKLSASIDMKSAKRISGTFHMASTHGTDGGRYAVAMPWRDREALSSGKIGRAKVRTP